MKYYFAPMEGITGYVFRNAHRACYPGMDKYFSPFIAPNSNTCMNSRERNDVLPEHNGSLELIPQILTNRAEDFLRTLDELTDYGYREVNLNLGCPSGTVVPKGKGSGFLAFPDKLDAFLDEVCQGAEKKGISVSVKTRLGLEDEEEFPRLLEIYNRYPLKELIVHPRLRIDYYGKFPRMESFAYAVRESRAPVCYNGNLFARRDIESLSAQFPDVKAAMLGRGLLAFPGLCAAAPGGAEEDRRTMRRFHDMVYAGYREISFGDKNVLFKMKEFWFFFIRRFSGGEKLLKKIRKAQRLSDYETAVDMVFGSLPLLDEADLSVLEK